jgi:RNA polymerase sigma-70 factor (ECF subfamily)
MTEAWRSAFETGRAAWPGVALPYVRFCERLAMLGHAPETVPEQVDAVYVCAAAELGDDAACRAIEERHFAALRALIARVDGRKDFIDEVLQLLRIQLFSGDRKIAGYAGRGPLERWLRTAAMRVAFRQKKVRGRLPSSLPEGSSLLALTTLPSGREEGEQPFKAGYARAFERALESAFAELRPRERAILRFHFAHGLNIEAIGRLYGVHRATVARWIAASREGLAGAVRAQLEGQFGPLPQQEFDSLVGVVYEALDLNVTALLRSSPQMHRGSSSEHAVREE